MNGNRKVGYIATWREAKEEVMKKSDPSTMTSPLNFEDLQTINVKMRVNNISREEVMSVLERYIRIKIEHPEYRDETNS